MRKPATTKPVRKARSGKKVIAKPAEPAMDVAVGRRIRDLRRVRQLSLETVAAICWIPATQVQQAAELIWHSRPVSYYAWSGHEQQANVTQTARAMSLLYALTGCFDAGDGSGAGAFGSGVNRIAW